jgi:glucosamine-6-phosphate deaminase
LRIRIFPTPDSAARRLAADVAAAIRANPSLVLALPTGQTPIAFYRHLAALHRDHAVDFSRVTTFNLDEFVGIGPSDPRSYRTFLQQHLFGQVNLSSHRIHCLNGGADDLGAECERYERAIARAGGIDLLILGLGRNGHVGFNEPGKSLVARTHRAKLAIATRHANRGLFGSRTADVPRAALSIGIGTILEARRIVLIATGAAKARPVERMINGPVTPWLPASFLQLHSAVDVWLDRAAAGRLRRPRYV